MAIFGLISNQTLDYVLRADPCRGPKGEALDGATVFKLRTLDGYAQAYLQDMMQRAESTPVHDGDDVHLDVKLHSAVFETAYEACRLGIEGWSNFKNTDGTDIPYKADKLMIGKKQYPAVARASLSKLGPLHAVELMRMIMSGLKISEDEEKNSDAAS